MLKANFSFGGKLVLVLVTVVVYTFVLIAGAIGGGLYAYNNVKVGDLLNLIQQSEWVSEEYAQKTIQQFITDLQKDLSGEGLTLQTIIDISPKTGEMLDGLVDNLNENGIVTIDREALYNTPVQNLSGSIMDVAVVTATLGSMQDTLGITLPDMPIFTGDGEENGGDVYVAANSGEGGALEKAYLYGDYTYYTKSTVYIEATETPEEPLTLYTPKGTIAEEEGSGYLTADGRYIYRNTGTEDVPEYTRIRLSSAVVYQVSDGILFKTDELYTRTGLGENDYSQLAFETDATEHYDITVKPEYLYQPLYADSEGKTAATNDAPDETTGRYTLKEGFENQTLYAAADEYTPVGEENLEDGVPTDEFLSGNTVYVRSDGLGALPLLSAVNALSGIFKMDTLSLRRAAEYFGISLESDLLTDILDVPLSYLGGGLDEAVQNFTLDSVIELNESNYKENELLFFIAYGDPENYTFDEQGNVVMKPGAKKNTVGDISGVINTMTIGNIVGESEHPLMKSIADWTINDFSDPDKINSLTIGDVIKIDETSEDTAKIMLALRDIPIGELSTAIDDLTIEQMVGTIDESNTLLYALRGCTLGNMNLVMQSLSLQDLFADDLYGYVYIGTAKELDENGAEKPDAKEGYDTRYEQLFVWESLNYTEKTAAEIAELPAETKIYARYILAYDGGYTAAEFENIPLYAYNPDAAEGEPQYVPATRVAYKLPQLPEGITEADLFAKDENGDYVAPEKDADGYYTVSSLYYLGADDKAAELSLLPSHIALAEGYENSILYSMFRIAEAVETGETAYYTQANLYYFDLDSQSFVRIPDAAPEDDPAAPYLEKLTDGEGTIGYIVHNVNGTVYTHGDTQGIWKYMLTNENGAEEIASLNDIGSLMSNITYNINHKSLREMRDDGVLDVSAATIETKIPDSLGGGTLGDKSISELLDLSVAALQEIERLEQLIG